MRGVYVIEFDIYPGIYKIGCSGNIQNRLKSFKKDSAILGEVKLVYKKEFVDYQKAEKEIHEILDSFRVQKNREFFKLELKEIIETIESVKDTLTLNHNIAYQNQIIDNTESQNVFEYNIDVNHFYETYINVIFKVSNLNNSLAKRVLEYICINADDEGNIAFTQELINKICLDVNITTFDFCDIINFLDNVGLISKYNNICKVDKGVYWKEGRDKIKNNIYKKFILRIVPFKNYFKCDLFELN